MVHTVLPRHNPTARDAVAAGSAAQPGDASLAPRRGPRVLVVEDQILLAVAIQQTVADAGYEVVGIASDAEDALRLAVQHRPDLILMDVSLGRGPDGIDAAHSIAAGMTVKIVFATAHTDEHTVARIAESGLGSLLAKPFSDDQLLAAMERALADPTGG